MRIALGHRRPPIGGPPYRIGCRRLAKVPAARIGPGLSIFDKIACRKSIIELSFIDIPSRRSAQPMPRSYSAALPIAYVVLRILIVLNWFFGACVLALLAFTFVDETWT